MTSKGWRATAGFVRFCVRSSGVCFCVPNGRSLKIRWRRERERATPSPSALLGWLERFHDREAPKAVAGTAFIPAVTAQLRGLWRVNQALMGFLQQHQGEASATLDMDATM